MELYVHTLMYWRKKKAKLKELSNNISDRSEAKGTGIMSDLLLVNGEARQLVANPHYTILLTTISNYGRYSEFQIRKIKLTQTRS